MHGYYSNERNNVRESKAKQTKMVTMDTGKMVPLDRTPLHYFGCRMITKSLSLCQPTDLLKAPEEGGLRCAGQGQPRRAQSVRWDKGEADMISRKYRPL